MVKNQIAYYLGSKILAAILNLVTMAIFVRMGGKETYGAYVVLLAWSYMLYSITLQWLRFSFFACFSQKRRDDIIATYLYGLVSGGGILVLLMLASIATKALNPEFAFGVFILVFGLAAYEGLSEIARTQLQARLVAIGVLLRSVLLLLFGVLALSYKISAFMLALAFGVSHLGTAVLLFLMSDNIRGGRWDRGLMKQLWTYGRPLMQAFGLDAVGLQLDRLMLNHFSTLENVGVYGAAADFIRQTMIVVSEAIAGAYFTIARSHVEKDEMAEAQNILGQAFIAYSALTLFAGAFILRFDRLIFDSLFGPEMGLAIEPVVTFIVLSNILAIYRDYYFGQGIYLTQNSHIVLYANGSQILVTFLLGIFLVPAYQGSGAALSMFVGHLASCLLYIFALRGHFILKLPFGQFLVILALALGLYSLSGMVETLIDNRLWASLLNITLFALVCAGAAWHYNILSFRDFFYKLIALLRRNRAVL